MCFYFVRQLGCMINTASAFPVGSIPRVLPKYSYCVDHIIISSYINVLSSLFGLFISCLDFLSFFIHSFIHSFIYSFLHSLINCFNIIQFDQIWPKQYNHKKLKNTTTAKLIETLWFVIQICAKFSKTKSTPLKQYEVKNTFPSPSPRA